MPVELASGPAWDLPDAPASEATGVTLLPGLDPTPMGYKERAWFLGPHEAALFDRNGNIGPSIWVDGRIVGGWAVDGEGRVRWRLLEPVGAAERSEIGAEVDRLTDWLQGTPVTPRFRTPLDKELATSS